MRWLMVGLVFGGCGLLIGAEPTPKENQPCTDGACAAGFRCNELQRCVSIVDAGPSAGGAAGGATSGGTAGGVTAAGGVAGGSSGGTSGGSSGGGASAGGAAGGSPAGGASGGGAVAGGAAGGVAHDVWSVGAPMSTPREGHTATLLLNGRVLVVGGHDGNASLGTSEIYDPIANSWSTPIATSHPAYAHTATRLNDGTVLITGGYAAATGVSNHAHLFDGGVWSQVSDMRSPRLSHAAIAMRDSGVIVVGGHTTGSGSQTNLVDFYNANTRGFDSRPNDLIARAELGLAELSTGDVLAFGGADMSGARVMSARYYPLTNQWLPTGSLNTQRTSLAWAKVDDGVLACGGFGPAGVVIQSCEMFTPVANGWDAGVGSMSSPRRSHTMTELTNGQVLVVGGAISGSDGTGSCELFTPTTGQWAPARPLTAGRLQHTATRLLDGRVLVVGGKTSPSGTVLNSVEIYTP